MIRVKSNTDIGRFAHDNLLGLLLGTRPPATPA